MMLTFKRLFTAFFLTPLTLIFLIMTLACHASDPFNEGSHHQHSHPANRDGGHTKGIDASETKGAGFSHQFSASPAEGNGEIFILCRQGDSVGEKEPIHPGSSQTKRKSHQIHSNKPTDLFKFLGQDYKGVEVPVSLGDPRINEKDERIQNYQSAMIFYNQNQAPTSDTFNWDDITKFMQEMDQRLFNTERSKISFSAGTIGFLMGCISSTPATGTLVSSVGDFFHIPVGESFSKMLVTWTMVTTTPSFAMNLGNRFYIIADSLFGKEAFSSRSDMEKALERKYKLIEEEHKKLKESELRAANPSLEQEAIDHKYKLIQEEHQELNESERRKIENKYNLIREEHQKLNESERRKVESTPCVFEISTLHKAAIGVLIVASGLDATVNVGVVALAYLKNFPNIFYGTGWAYFLSWMERYYTTGRAKIDRLACKYQYDTELSHRKRLFLLDSLNKCQQAIAGNDSFVTALYTKIFNKIKGKNLQDEESGNQVLFALSALFLQSINMMQPSAESSEKEPSENTKLIDANARLTNFQVQQDAPLSWKEEFLNELSTYLAGAASIGRAVSMEYILEQLMIYMLSIPAPAATGIAWSASIFDLTFRSFTESDTQKEYMQGWLKSLSLKHLGYFQWLRKITGWPATINGSLFALAKTVAGITGFNTWGAPIPVQVICLVPAFIQDQGYYGAFFGDGTQKMITNAATIKQPQLNEYINVKRAWLMKWSRKIEGLLTSQWDRDTIGNLYTTILKGC